MFFKIVAIIFECLYVGVLATTKLAENGGRPVHRTRFGKSTGRDHPSSNKTLSKLATRALMTEFRMQSSMGQVQQEKSRKNHNFLDGCEIDLSQCQCAEVSFRFILMILNLFVIVARCFLVFILLAYSITPIIKFVSVIRNFVKRRCLGYPKLFLKWCDMEIGSRYKVQSHVVFF